MCHSQTYTSHLSWSVTPDPKGHAKHTFHFHTIPLWKYVLNLEQTGPYRDINNISPHANSSKSTDQGELRGRHQLIFPSSQNSFASFYTHRGVTLLSSRKDP